MNLKDLMNTLRVARRARGLSADDAAALVGSTSSTLYEWEMARKAPSVEKLLAYLSALGLTISIDLDAEEPDLAPRDEEPADVRAHRLLTRVWDMALWIRDDDLATAHAQLKEVPKADLVAMVVLAAACIPVEQTRARLLKWWDGQGLRLSDLISTCPWCHTHFTQALGEQTRVYCTATCRGAAFRDRKNNRRRSEGCAAA